MGVSQPDHGNTACGHQPHTEIEPLPPLRRLDQATDLSTKEYPATTGEDPHDEEGQQHRDSRGPVGLIC